MYARDFNAKVVSVLWPIVEPAGFKKLQSCFVWERGEGQLVLFRFGGKFSSLCQFTRFMLCFRHTFLRDLFEKVPTRLPSNGHDFPFRLQPTSLRDLRIDLWTYSFRLNEDRFDSIEFGQMSDCRPILREIGELVANKGVLWAERLTEKEALRQLTTYGQRVFCERLWIEDYEKRL